MTLGEKIKQKARELAPKYTDVRRYLHAHPELSFQEFDTCRYLKNQLLKLGVNDIHSVANTGLLATIKGGKEGRQLVLRSDMDALPILETNNIEYTSRNDGVMHACGHDAHMSSLLLCAEILIDLKEELRGTVHLLFQPAEELMPGGASLVMKEPIYQKLGQLPHIGQHVRPDLPVGTIGFRPGKFMASMDELFLTIKGKGGHAAMPENAVDSVLIASHIIVAAQQLVSRMASPKTPSVLSFGKVIADGAINVLPDEVYIEGTFRTMDEAWRSSALKKLNKMVVAMAESMGATAELKIKHGYPHLINDRSLTSELRVNAISFVGKENVIDLDQWMASEDFSYYSHEHPSCFYMLGVGSSDKNIDSGLHTSTFNIDESALEIGGGLIAFLAISKLRD
ncbi:MAG: N-acyl-L-amino acid amidohydrolase [Pseudozobellia sp.]|nr:N-acyl-L-amino acid amidohydrolase [Pseudozobellia sp.]MBG50090.1 N-acyl-L-amino acid amidohydrolase [Pseudozobellia sp.]